MASKKRKAESIQAPAAAAAAITPERVVSNAEQEQPTVDPPFFDESKLSEIQKILRVHLASEDEAVVCKGLKNLGDLATVTLNPGGVGKKNSKELTEAGGGAIIAAVMRKWHAHVGIQISGIRAIGENAYARDCEMTKRANATGVLDAVVWAVKKYSDNADVQVIGFGTLDNLCDCHVANSKYVVQELDILPSLIKTITSFKDHVVVIEEACDFLKDLSQVQELRENIIDAGGIQALGDSIRVYKKDTRPVKGDYESWAKEALRNLCETP